MSTKISVVNVSSAAKLRAEEIKTPGPIVIHCSSSGDVITDVVAHSAEIDVSSSGRCQGNITSDKLLVGLSSSGRYVGRVIIAEKLSVNASSAGKCTVEGRCKELDVDLSSASDFEGGELQAARVSVDASSAAKATVWATDQLGVDLSSAAGVRYKGSPMLTATNISSGASLRKIEE
jgi:cytoskeletal protein CcmA (bactofilin family)